MKDLNLILNSELYNKMSYKICTYYGYYLYIVYLKYIRIKLIYSFI
jgi:hypothetical protein